MRLLVLLLAAAACGASTPAERQREEIEAAFERVVAPCCWLGTIDSHESPLARDLRDEVARRVAAGERGAEILDDLVRRYGERVRTTPPGGWVPWLLYALAGVAVVLVTLVARRWVRRGRAEPAAAGTSPRKEDERLAAKLDDELAELD